MIALLFQQRHREEFALGFGHFAALGVEVHDMHPVIAPLVPQIGLALRNLVGVVRERIVNTAAMEVQPLAQMFERNGRALDVPTGIAHAKGAVPLEFLILEFGLGKPEHKVGFVFLVVVPLHALAHTLGQILGVVVVENIIFLQFGSVKIDIAARTASSPYPLPGIKINSHFCGWSS